MVEGLDPPLPHFPSACELRVRSPRTRSSCVLDTAAYRTSDLYYASYLRVAGVPFVGTERKGKRVVFLFEDIGAPLHDLKQGYFYDSARVPALSYVQMIRSMKSLVHRTP